MKKLQNQITFIGRPFADQLMDEQRSFKEANLQMEQSQVFQHFLEQNHLTDFRSSMIVFGPDNFMYWYGVVTNNDVEVPSELMKFVLPEAQVAAVEQQEQNLSFFSQPLNLVLPDFLEQVAEEGIKSYENPGDSSTPYVLQNLNLKTKKLTQMLYLEDSQ